MDFQIGVCSFKTYESSKYILKRQTINVCIDLSYLLRLHLIKRKREMVCVSEDQGSNWGRSRNLQRGLAQVLKGVKEAWKTAGIFQGRQQGQGHG